MREKLKSYITQILLFFALSMHVHGQVPMLPVDSLFLHGIAGFYAQAEDATRTIWPGMEASPVCLYRVNGPAILYNHPDPPDSFVNVADRTYLGTQAELQLMGSTIAEINGVITAIADYGYETYMDEDQVYAVLFHEMHHAYQFGHVIDVEYDNPAVLLVYPEDPVNDAIKLFEQQLLYEMVFTADEDRFSELLNLLYSSRKQREDIIGSVFVNYEKAVENLEGPAFFCEYRFYNVYGSGAAEVKMNYNHKHFWSILNTPFYGRQELRKRHLAAGLAMCYILDKFSDGWQEAFYAGGSHLYDFFMAQFNVQQTDLPGLDAYLALSSFHTPQLMEQRQARYQAFIDQPGVQVVLQFGSFPQFRGFDPMNAEAISDELIFHKTTLNLAKADNQLFVANEDVVTTIQDQVWFVKQAVFFVDSKEDVWFEEGRVEVAVPGITLQWTAELISDEDGKMVFSCR